jgi:glyoxylase-like metal-dependent hydrolase (beta-lactamase superfamily II)
MNISAQARIHSFFDSSTSTFSYVVHPADGVECAIIDPVLGYDLRSGVVSSAPAKRIADFVRTRGLRVGWILETHVHADHLSGAAWLRDRIGGRVGISERVVEVQRCFKEIFNFGADFVADGSDFDYLFKPEEPFLIGSLEAVAMQVPGHTPADIAYRIGAEAVFVGDTLFMPDVGTARCDFPGGDSRHLYKSIKRILSLAPDTRIYLCHDYPADGRDAQYLSDVAAQRAGNVHIHDGVDMAEFARMRSARDACLPLPQLFYPSLQTNMRAGRLPRSEENGRGYFKFPFESFDAVED